MLLDLLDPEPLVGGTDPEPLVGGTDPEPLVRGTDPDPSIKQKNCKKTCFVTSL
jgi:hypothetical protein